MDASWFRLATLDSAVVSMPDGTSAALYQRDPELFRDLMKRTLEIHERLYREWPQLAERYRDQLGDHLAERWEKTFAASTQEHAMRAANKRRPSESEPTAATARAGRLAGCWQPGRLDAGRRAPTARARSA